MKVMMQGGLSLLMALSLTAAAFGQVRANAQQTGKEGLEPFLSFDEALTLAQQGDGKGLFQMALRYASGTDVPRDETIAIQFLKKAYDVNYPNAVFYVGLWMERCANHPDVYGRNSFGPYYPYFSPSRDFGTSLSTKSYLKHGGMFLPQTPVSQQGITDFTSLNMTNAADVETIRATYQHAVDLGVTVATNEIARLNKRVEDLEERLQKRKDEELSKQKRDEAARSLVAMPPETAQTQKSERDAEEERQRKHEEEFDIKSAFGFEFGSVGSNRTVKLSRPFRYLDKAELWYTDFDGRLSHINIFGTLPTNATQLDADEEFKHIKDALENKYGIRMRDPYGWQDLFEFKNDFIGISVGKGRNREGFKLSIYITNYRVKKESEEAKLAADKAKPSLALPPETDVEVIDTAPSIQKNAEEAVEEAARKEKEAVRKAHEERERKRAAEEMEEQKQLEQQRIREEEERTRLQELYKDWPETLSPEDRKQVKGELETKFTVVYSEIYHGVIPAAWTNGCGKGLLIELESDGQWFYLRYNGEGALMESGRSEDSGELTWYNARRKELLAEKQTAWAQAHGMTLDEAKEKHPGLWPSRSRNRRPSLLNRGAHPVASSPMERLRARRMMSAERLQEEENRREEAIAEAKKDAEEAARQREEQKRQLQEIQEELRRQREEREAREAEEAARREQKRGE